MLRVLHVIGSLNVGGSQSFVINVYKEIDREKVQFDFVVDRQNELQLKETIEELGGRVYYIPKYNGHNLCKVISMWRKFLTDHKEFKIIHSHIRSYALIYLLIARKHGLKTVIHSHSTSNGFGFSSIIKKVLQYPLRYVCDYYFACSREAGEWLFGKKIVDSENFRVINNGIDSSEFAFNPAIRKDMRRNLKIGNQKVYINVGRFTVAKNHRFLLEVFKEISLIQTESVLILVGDGPEKNNIVNIINELKIQDKVLMLGTRKDVNRVLQAADCFLFTSEWEGLGIAAIAAQASGLPCICSNTIPSNVKVTDYCKFISLDAKEEWVKEALTFSLERTNTQQEIIKAGFDIHEVAKEIHMKICN